MHTMLQQAGIGLALVSLLSFDSSAAIAQSHHHSRVRSFAEVPGSESIFDYTHGAPPPPVVLKPTAESTSIGANTGKAGAGFSKEARVPALTEPLVVGQWSPDEVVSEEALQAYLKKDFCRFEADQMPIRIRFLQHRTSMDERYRQMTLAAMREWAKASQGIIKFKEVEAHDRANITVHWRPYNSKLDGRPDRTKTMGTTQLSFKDVGVIDEADVCLHTHSGVLDKVIVLHELGHALGLQQHTTWPQTVMHATEDAAIQHLFENDAGLIYALYSKPIALAAKPNQWVKTPIEFH